jgi:hypothetical protein
MGCSCDLTWDHVIVIVTYMGVGIKKNGNVKTMNNYTQMVPVESRLISQSRIHMSLDVPMSLRRPLLCFI